MRNPNALLNRRLPAYAGILVMLVTIAITVTLSRNTLVSVSKATVGSTPKKVQISNVTTDSFTVSYMTDARVMGAVSYGPQPQGGSIGLDVRDSIQTPMAERMVHYITVSKLQPGTRYYFTISSGGQTMDNNGKPYEVFTPTNNTNVPLENGTLKGTVSYTDGTLPAEGIVSITGDNTQTFTSLIQPDGSYTIPLVNLRATDLQSYITLTPDAILELEIDTALVQSTAKIAAKQISAVPKIILSKNYDFTISPDDTSTTSATESAENNTMLFPEGEAPPPATAPEIASPKDDQQFKDDQPVFRGRALPNTTVELIINSTQEISVQLQSDTNGNWEFRPPMGLEPGNHTLTIVSPDIDGIQQRITRSFTVYAQGSQFVEPSVSPIASPSARPTNVPITLTPTPFVLPSPIASPTATLFPSPTMELPSPTPITASQSASIQPTGSSLFINGLIGILTAFGIGTLLFIVTAL